MVVHAIQPLPFTAEFETFLKEVKAQDFRPRKTRNGEAELSAGCGGSVH